MDQFNGSGAPGGTPDAGTIPSGGGGSSAPQTQQGAGGAPGAGSMPWESDERFRGKGPADVWKSYTELQKKAGGLPDLEKRVQEWEKFGQAWEPYLKHVGWDPNRLAQALERAAANARQQGNMQQANQLQNQADRAWADALTPESQEQWIGERMTKSEQKVMQHVQQVATQLVDYFNRFGDLALRAVEQKFGQLPENIRPKLAINDLLQEAVNIATNRYDPLEWAAKIRTAEPQDAVEARIRADERAKIEAELKNRQLTTFSGVGTGNPRSMKPRTAINNPQTGQAPVTRDNEAAQIGRARERFAANWSNLAQE